MPMNLTLHWTVKTLLLFSTILMIVKPGGIIIIREGAAGENHFSSGTLIRSVVDT